MVDTLHATLYLAPVYQDPDPLPARLRAARCAHHLTRAALARRTGLPACLIGRVERGEPSLTLALREAGTEGASVSLVSEILNSRV